VEPRELKEISDRADDNPSDVAAQIAAAYACDSSDLETEAVVYYDRVWSLGVPADERHDFLIGYGSTLRNVGRLEDSIEVLNTAVGEHEEDLSARSFLALALHSAGRSDEAVAMLIEAVVEGGGAGVYRFSPALESYAEELRSNL
jgi:tetratricopeptide (TPR) repeat protein